MLLGEGLSSWSSSAVVWFEICIMLQIYNNLATLRSPSSIPFHSQSMVLGPEKSQLSLIHPTNIEEEGGLK